MKLYALVFLLVATVFLVGCSSENEVETAIEVTDDVVDQQQPIEDNSEITQILEDDLTVDEVDLGEMI